ncbi:hypothetical protein I4U23_014255 [Adineta vaga]|nr:hypothetical protein I4U23_014255 [Adineta vaga]
MKFQFNHQIVLSSVPIDLAFERLTSASHLEQVTRLSESVTDFQLLSNENDVLRYQFVDNISMLSGLVKKSITTVVKQSRDRNKKTTLSESDVDQGTVTIVKCRSLKPTDDGGTLVLETIEGECSMLHQPFCKQQGYKALVEHMNKYHTLFNDVKK